MKYPLYKDNLCPKLWHVDEDGHRLDNQVQKMLLTIANDFVKGIKDDHKLNIKIHDVVIVGSVANYNWTDYSDIDLHIVVDFGDLEMSKEDAQTMFDAIKTSWNFKHDIKMKGHDVELYVQDIDHVTTSTAEYSVLNNKWVKEPKKEDPTFDKELIKRKYKEYKKQINDLVQNHDETKLKKLLEKLYQYRQAGLDKGGELSEENIVFKVLRALGHLDKLKDGINNIYDKKVSVKETNLNEGVSDIAKTVYQHAVNSIKHVARDGNTLTMYGAPTPNQMKYLNGKSGSFMFGDKNTRINYYHDPREPRRIKFTWNF